MNLIKKNIILSIIFLIISIILIRLILGQDSFAFDEHIYSENYDIVSNQLALKFFINDVWHFPLGKNPNYGMGVGNSVVFSEAIPILAFFAKLFKNFLPTNFQLISIWFVICFTLQLLLSYLIINNFNSEGEIAPENLPLIANGALKNTLVSSRTEKEYGVTSNFANEGEGLRSPKVARGELD